MFCTELLDSGREEFSWPSTLVNETAYSIERCNVTTTHRKSTIIYCMHNVYKLWIHKNVGPRYYFKGLQQHAFCLQAIAYFSS